MKSISMASIISFVNGSIIGDHKDLEQIYINNVSIDSRDITENSLFIPIVGDNFDGHDFIKDAFENGAKAVLTHKKIDLPDGKIALLVDDTRLALRDLAERYLQLFHIPVIAVTGSVGKTSCKDMIASVLSRKYKVLKTEGNYNNDIGLPLTVLRTDDDHDVLVLEMGMNHFNEISILSKIARPDYAVITNIGVSHIENLGSREGILKAKCEIFDYMKPSGIGIINLDDDYLPSIQDNVKFQSIGFGLYSNASYTAKEIQERECEGMLAVLQTPNHRYHVTIPALGQHMIYNVLPAVIIGEHLGLNKKDIIEGIKAFIPTKMRLNRYKLGNNIIIIDDVYNASPDSMKAALSTLSNLPSEGRKVAILGDMFEMGSHAKEGHLQVGGYAKNAHLDLLICVGENARYIKEGFGEEQVKHYKTIEDLLTVLENEIKVKDTILLKASRGMHFEIIIDHIKKIEFK